MDEALRIYTERLRGKTETINEEIPPAFMDIHEKELAFKEPVKIHGEAYLAQDDLILQLTLSTIAEMPCAICNNPVAIPLKAELLHSEPITHLKRGVFEMGSVIREAILLELPLKVECHEGKCPERKNVKKFLKDESASDADLAEGGYHPFSDLKLDSDDK